jgi:hypothetical protein
VDTNWYGDTGATDHITGELNKLTMKEKYTGREQIHAANGQGMNISHVGHAIVNTPSKSLHLKMFIMFHTSQKILSQFIALLEIIKYLLNFTRGIFMSRIRQRRKFFLKYDVCVASSH